MQYRPQTVQTTNFEDAKWLDTKFPESTYIPRVPQCMSPCPNLDPPTPSPPSECVPSNGTKRGETPSPADEGVGESQFGRLEKTPIKLCLLCGPGVQCPSKNSLLQNVEPQNDRNTNYLVLNVLDANLSRCITSLIFNMNSIVYCGM